MNIGKPETVSLNKERDSKCIAHPVFRKTRVSVLRACDEFFNKRGNWLREQLKILINFESYFSTPDNIVAGINFRLILLSKSLPPPRIVEFQTKQNLISYDRSLSPMQNRVSNRAFSFFINDSSPVWPGTVGFSRTVPKVSPVSPSSPKTMILLLLLLVNCVTHQEASDESS